MQRRDAGLWLVFAAVARQGSFTGAAKALGLSKSLVSEQIAALEARCGARLFDRTTRRLHLTQVGAELLRATADLERALRTLDGVLEDHAAAPVGTLRVATTTDLGARLVIPAASDVALRHPGLSVEVVCDDAPTDLVGGGFDLAVRLGAPRDSGFIMRKIAAFDEPILAAPALAQRLGPAEHPLALANAPAVCHALVHPLGAWVFQRRAETQTVPLSVRARANTSEGVRALLLAGLGVGCLPDYLVHDDLARGALVTLCPGWIWRRVSLYTLLPSSGRPARRVSLFIEALAGRLPGPHTTAERAVTED